MGSKIDRYKFRPLEVLDLKFFNFVRNSAAPFLHDQRHFSLDETIQWFEKGPPSSYWIVEMKEIPIGYFRCLALDSRTVMIGADLHLDFQGKGFAKSMYQEFAQSILMPQGFTTCTLRVLRSNERALRLYLKLGFIQTSETVEELSMKMKVEDLANGTIAPR